MKLDWNRLQTMALILVAVAIAVYDLFWGHQIGKEGDLIIIVGALGAGGVHIAWTAGGAAAAALHVTSSPAPQGPPWPGFEIYSREHPNPAPLPADAELEPKAPAQ